MVLPVGSGNIAGLVGLEDKLLYATFSQPSMTYGPPNGQFSVSIKYFDLKKRESKTVISGVNGFDVSSDGKKLIYRAGSRYGVVDSGSEAEVGDETVDLGEAKILVDRQGEFEQIFAEAWRVQRDWFYDPGMHGVDWDHMY